MKTNETTPIPQGYKATPLGIIPQEWEVKKLGDISQCFSGGTPKAGNNEYYCGNIPFIRSGEIHQKDTELFLSELGLAESSAKMVQKGDLLMALYGANSGNSAVSQIDGAINQAILCIRPRNVLVSFLCPFLELNKDMYIAKYLQGGQGNLSGEIVLNYKIPVPPLAEQKKIAEVLGVWDKAIEKQSQLIEQLTLRKRGLMQQLLTAKRRLPGFSEPWKTVRLGEIGHFLSSNTLSRDNLNEDNGNIRNIHYGDILIKLPTIVDLPFIHIPYINNGIVVKSDYLKDGDIIFADTAEDYTVGKAIEIINIGAALVTSGLHTIPFRPKCGIFVSRFLGYYVNSIAYQRQLQPLIQGIKVCSISKTALCTTVLKVPTLAEQTAIAEVLTAADREIELAQQKLELLRQQKRGLMQQLLTGKKRVKV